MLNFGHCAVRGHPEVKRVAFSDSLYRILKLHTAASKQRRFAGFYVEKIPAKNLPPENSQHQIGESSPVGRVDSARVGCLLYCSFLQV